MMSNYSIESNQDTKMDLLKSPTNLKNDSTTVTNSISSSSPTAKFSTKLKKFKGKPSIIDEPKLIELCERYTITKNIEGLSLIARQRGLPPHLRHKVWPLLLKTHPFLIKPYITPDEDDDQEELDELELRSKIRHDLQRYFKRSHNHIDVNERNGNQSVSRNPELVKIEDEIIKVMEYSILKFLKKWGSLINYNSGLSWVALGLAEWVPPLNSQDDNYVLCGREIINKNGGSCLTKMEDESNELIKLNDDDSFYKIRNSSPCSNSSINKKTDTMSETSSVSTFTTNSSTQEPIIKSSTSKNLSFAEVYERMVLVILHSPKPSEDSNSSHDTYDDEDQEETIKEKILTTLPIKGGTAEERLSFFLYCLRRLLPELAQFFTDEDILNTTSAKDDWVVWWLKWCGAKVWSKYDRGRIWDMLLGWRLQDDFNNFDELNDLVINDDILKLLGPDIFWHPLTFKENEEETNNEKRRNSIKKLISSLSINDYENNQQEQESILDLKQEIPYSNLNPHTEIVFISLSFIKSKEFALLELEQSEIREFLNKASSTKLDGFQNLFEDEINSNEFKHNDDENNDLIDSNNDNDELQDETNTNTNTNNNNNNNNDYEMKIQKNRLREIENIIMESGELWRKWIWQEAID